MKTDRSSKTTVSHYETKKEVHRMTFLSPYVPPVAQVVWGVEIHSIPHVIWKSNFCHLIQFLNVKILTKEVNTFNLLNVLKDGHK